MEAPRILTITGVSAYRYRMPLKRPYGTARGITRGSTNFIVQLEGLVGGASFTGLGECQPRHVLTGDGGKSRNSAWRFLKSALALLEGATLDVSTRDAALAAVREHMTKLTRLARRKATKIHGDKPFRGTLLGIEVALLDVCARALDLRISELIGEKREEVRVSISTISTSVGLDAVASRAARQKRFPVTRLKGGSEVEYNIDLLRAAAAGNEAAGRVKPLWIDINEAMDLSTAKAFVRRAAEEMARGNIPAQLTIEGPLSKQDGVLHADLQKFASDIVDSYCGEAAIEIDIMLDESIWDSEDLKEIEVAGGTNAINIKAPKAGGLLASVELAQAAVAADPTIKIGIGGMVGTSEVTAWALHNLARSMPRIDYTTTVPPRNVQSITTTPSAYAEEGSNLIAAQKDKGLGTSLDAEKLKPFVVDEFHLGGAAEG